MTVLKALSVLRDRKEYSCVNLAAYPDEALQVEIAGLGLADAAVGNAAASDQINAHELFIFII